MYIRITTCLIVAAILVFIWHMPAFSVPLLSGWQQLMDAGTSAEEHGDYRLSAQKYAQAVATAESNHLPEQCLIIALCQETQSEVYSNQISNAESHFQKLASLLRKQADMHAPPDLKVLSSLMGLEDTYSLHTDPKTRETCLKHACLLKFLAPAAKTSKERMNALLLLVDYYIEDHELDKAAKSLKEFEALKLPGLGQDSHDLANVLFIQALSYNQQKRYQEAKQIGLLLLALADQSSGHLTPDRSAFYTFLSMNAQAEGHHPESKQYASRAIKEGLKLASPALKQSAKRYFSLLEMPIWSSPREDKLNLALSDFAELTAIELAVFESQADQSDFLKRLVDPQNRLAIKSTIAQQYEKVQDLESPIVKTVATRSNSALSGLPAFYALLGITTTARTNKMASPYFDLAKKACPLIKGVNQKQLALSYLDLLIDPIWAQYPKASKLPMIESWLRLLVSLEGAISKDPTYQFQALSRLSAVLACERKPAAESEKPLERCIAIAQRPKSPFQQELPDLCMRLAIIKAAQHNSIQSENEFRRALDFETNRAGYHYALTLWWWGFCLYKQQRYLPSNEKLQQALTIARNLPVKERGCLLGDTFEVLSFEAAQSGRVNESRSLMQERAKELLVQQKVGYSFESVNIRPGLAFMR
jgi:hypothetical protein